MSADLAASAASSSAVTAIILVCSFVGLLTAVWFAYQVSRIRVSTSSSSSSSHSHVSTAQSKLIPKGEHKEASDDDEFHTDVTTIGKAISEGANAFLFQEYEYMGVFVLLFGILLLILLGVGHTWYLGLFAMIAFFCGATTSVLCGFIGMRIAVYANVRTAISAQRGCADSQSKGFELAFDTAFKGGAVMGFALVSLGLLVLYILINAFHLYWSNAFEVDGGYQATKDMYEAIAGYGLGGSTVALFGRVGGGIYTKAADVGADLAGKVEEGLPEDDPRNPACIADNVGDNVGDIAGMGADLFGSFAESSCATMVIASQSPDLFHDWPAMCFPLVLSATGIIVCLLTTFVATHLMPTKRREEVEPSLKRQLLVSTLLMTPVVYGITQGFLPDEFHLSDGSAVKNWYIFFTISVGLWSGLIIGYITEYYTSHAYTPVREVAGACTTGAATNIIYGLALGYQSVIIPAICIAITIYTSYSLAGMFGIATAALGILSTLSVGLTIDGYGPICDNAGGIAEMAGMPRDVRVVTDSLDAAGNTTAAIGKGFAIGSAAFVSLALFGAFVTAKDLTTVDILQPFQFAGLLIGAMLPYWFSAMTMKSVGQAALAMVEEVRRQFATCPLDEEGKKNLTAFRPDYAHCVAISTKAALHKMIPPGLLVLLTPIIVGFFFGVDALCGVLAGSLVSGVQMAISSANSGGAWDNAKKFIEIDGKGSEKHKAAVIGDTVGDPLKDTSGPSLNILIKLMAIISLVFAPAFPSSGLLVQLFHQ